MAKNIYELFNERKNGMDYLVEGYDVDFEGAEGFESLEVAVESLDEITESFNNEMMEFQAACYLEELIIESMIYDDFDEERIGAVIEGTIKEKMDGVVERLKKYWEQLKAWVANAYTTVTNFFKSGEALLKQYGNSTVADAIRKCGKKVRVPDYEPANKAMGGAYNLMTKCKSDNVDGMGKNEVLAQFGIKKVKEIEEKVHELFVKGDRKEVAISALNPNDIINAIEQRAALVDMLNKYKKDLDNDFKSAIAKCKRGRKDAEGAEADVMGSNIEAFKLAQTIKNKICSKALNEFRFMHGNYVQIVKAAVNPMRAAKAAKKEEKEKAKAAQESYNEIEFL